jgi:hypothetical protein
MPMIEQMPCAINAIGKLMPLFLSGFCINDPEVVKNKKCSYRKNYYHYGE